MQRDCATHAISHQINAFDPKGIKHRTDHIYIAVHGVAVAWLRALTVSQQIDRERLLWILERRGDLRPDVMGRTAAVQKQDGRAAPLLRVRDVPFSDRKRVQDAPRAPGYGRG